MQGALSSNLSRAWIEQKDRRRVVCCCLSWHAHPPSPALGHWCSCFLALWTQTGTYTISFFVSQAFRMEMNYKASFSDSPAYRQQILGLLDLHNHHVSHFIHIYIFIYMNRTNIYIFGSVSLRTLTNTSSITHCWGNTI